MTNRLGKGDQTRMDMELVAKKLLDNSELCFPECVQSWSWKVHDADWPVHSLFGFFYLTAPLLSQCLLESDSRFY